MGEKLSVFFNNERHFLDKTLLEVTISEMEKRVRTLKPSLPAGLYSTGAIALCESGDVEAAKAMLQTSWEELEASGAIVVSEGPTLPVLPEMNEYGFYYGVQYSVMQNGIAMGGFTFYEDSSIIFNNSGEIEEIPAGLVVYKDHLIDMSALGMVPLYVHESGVYMEAEGVILSLGDGTPPKGSIYIGLVDNAVPVLTGDLVISSNEHITGIALGGFINQSSLTNIIIPDNIKSIGAVAFQNCTNLANINIPDSVTEIGNYAFERCTNLANINISKNITKIRDYTFASCDNLTNIIIPEGVISIEENAFSSCENLRSAIVPNSVTTIGPKAFLYCYKLTSINMPKNLLEIGYSAFDSCRELTNIVIPASVLSIGSSAFSYCGKIDNIVIPEGVTSIEPHTFDYCKSLKSITIPSSVTSIGMKAFYSSNDVKFIFTGTMSQWNAITFGKDWNGYVHTTYVQCSDGQVTL